MPPLKIRSKLKSQVNRKSASNSGGFKLSLKRVERLKEHFAEKENENKMAGIVHFVRSHFHPAVNV